jgi:hypothetical protein
MGEGDPGGQHQGGVRAGLGPHTPVLATRFAKAPFDERDLHRPLVGDDDLDDAFAWKEDRTVSKNLTLRWHASGL